MPELGLVVLQPTPFCNISCKYCYLPNRGSTEQMSASTLERVFSNVFSSGWVGGNLDIAWHAGEPLVLPIRFYEDAIQIINSMVPDGVDVNHVFQTNGTLISAEWCEFFSAVNANVGISIDGPPNLNDATRTTRTGRSTYDKTIAGIRLLRANGIKFHVITVLTAMSMAHAKELYEFYQSEGIERVCFNVEEIEGIHLDSTLNVEGIEERYANFLRSFWNLNVKFQSLKYIREFSNMFRNIVVPADARIRNSLAEPFAILNVDHAGNFSTYCPELLGNKSADYADFLAGNIWQVSLQDALRDERFRKLREDVAQGVELCRASCDHFGVCGGGSPGNKFFENGAIASTETLACRLGVKTVAEVSLEVLETTAIDSIVEADLR